MLAGIAMHPLDVYRARPLKPTLKFKLHQVTYPEIVHPDAACLGPLKVNFLPVFGPKCSRNCLSARPA